MILTHKQLNLLNHIFCKIENKGVPISVDISLMDVRFHRYPCLARVMTALGEDYKTEFLWNKNPTYLTRPNSVYYPTVVKW